MMATMLNRVRVAGLAALGLGAGLTLAGCDSSNPGGGQAAPAAGGPPQMTGMPGMPGGPGAAGPEVEDTGPYAAGKKVFRAQNCGRCHPLPGMGPQGFAMMGPGRGGPGRFPGGPGGPPPGGPPPGGPGGAPPGGPGGFPGGPGGPGGFPGGPGGGPGRPPDLSKVGADPEHTVEWIAEHIRDPKSHTPKSRMPPYGEDKINNDDLQALAEFLASLKGDESSQAKEQDGEQKSEDSE